MIGGEQDVRDRRSSVVADAIRRKVVWVVLVFAVFLGLSIPALPSYGVGVAASVFREVAIALTYIAAIVVALALSATRIPVEVERRTVFNVISRDVRRWQYVAGSWLGMFVVLGGVIALCCVGHDRHRLLHHGGQRGDVAPARGCVRGMA